MTENPEGNELMRFLGQEVDMLSPPAPKVSQKQITLVQIALDIEQELAAFQGYSEILKSMAQIEGAIPFLRETGLLSLRTELLRLFVTLEASLSENVREIQALTTVQNSVNPFDKQAAGELIERLYAFCKGHHEMMEDISGEIHHHRSDGGVSALVLPMFQAIARVHVAGMAMVEDRLRDMKLVQDTIAEVHTTLDRALDSV